MNSETARNVMILLTRVDIKGAEAPMFMQIMHELQGIVDAKPAAAADDAPAMKLVNSE